MSDQTQATNDPSQATKRTVYGPRNVMVQGIQIESAKLFQPGAGESGVVRYYPEGRRGYGIPVYDHRAIVNNRVHDTATETRWGLQAEADESLLKLINSPATVTIREKKDVDGTTSIFVHLYDITIVSAAPVAQLFFIRDCILHGKGNPLCYREEQEAALVVTDGSHRAVVFEDDSYLVGADVINHTPVAYHLDSQLRVVRYHTYEAPGHAIHNYPSTKGTAQRDLDAATFMETGNKLIAKTQASKPKAKRQPELVGATA